ncbi:SET domain protein [Guyanagaster necrorhizus]|uniref:SET domain protein n=1 Tax=Guyanagaster necrorhizus TaxID=856835 RepID=A0A9P7VZG7_9AGAR|nr:SET domain protein [Guyanagaster necrorhizus MCA 3950]KAG7449423.1 SET domain protein [Guyanagaster necrorhizus MCA 3950]
MSQVFTAWLKEKGGSFHNYVQYVPVPSGYSILAKEKLPADSTIVSCPFDLVITKTVALRALSELLPSENLLDWSGRQCISSYLCFHHILDESSYIPDLAHGPYVNTLPSREKLRTGLHFTPLELEMFKGTNMHGAIVDREKEWRHEWETCRSVVSKVDRTWGDLELFLESATHVSSRAFPSSLLDPNPTLQSSPSTEPVLLPGIDALNHARAHPVSWVVTYHDNAASISLIIHKYASSGKELFNNYGAKPNSEFILGYGFSLPNNPDDTIVLKIGDKKWEVGREAKGADEVWNAFLSFVSQNEEPDYEDCLEAAAVLDEAVQQLIERLPTDKDPSDRLGMRPEVMAMLHDYVEGQRDILCSLAEFCEAKKRLAVEMAEVQGIDLVFDDDH